LRSTALTAAAQAITSHWRDRLRADLYNYLGVMLARPADRMLLDQTAACAGDDIPWAKAINGLRVWPGPSTPKRWQTGILNALFIGLGRGELLPYGSY